MKFRFPTAFTILYALIILVAALTWVIPAGEYEMTYSEALDKEVPVAGTYKQVESNPQGLKAIILAPIAGLYDPDSYEANAIDVALFVLMIGGFLGVVTKTGAINAGIARIMKALSGREQWMIPILMFLFAAGGTTYGMAEETLAFYMIVIPVMIAAGYDAVTGVAIILIGAGIGVLGSTINPFATVIASNAADIPFTQGMVLRFMILILGWILCVGYVMRYAAKVRADPSASIVADMKEDNEAYFVGKQKAAEEEMPDFTGTHKVVLTVFALTFAVMIWGVSAGGWWMAEMSGLFLVAAIIVGFIGRLGERELTTSFVDGARELLGVALIIGVARGIVVVMDAGQITATILYWSELSVAGLSNVLFINTMYWVQVGLSFFVPSSSGLAVLTMPIMAPLTEFAGVDRSLAVTAYQSANGLVNFINPTFAVVMGGLALGRVPYERWLRFTWPLLVLLTILIMLMLSLGAMA